MRRRKVKGADIKLLSYKDYVLRDNIEALKGKWNEKFNNNNPIHVEFGTGRGKFITTLASQNPDINYIGIEKFSSVLVRAIEKKENHEAALDNLVFLRFDAEYIEEIFAPEEIGRIYLNFSDPWPKDRHAKRRLTSKEFFARYNNVLAKDGVVIFKTDNKDLFDFSLEQVVEAKWNLLNKTYDLHNSEYVEGNVMTEYETRFVNEGIKINRMEVNR